MANSRTYCTISVLLLSLTGAFERGLAQDTTEDASIGQVQQLFDGQTLKGWSGDERFWRVEGGVIVGQTTEDQPTEKNTFLIWQGGELANFRLRFQYKMEGGNSGVQIRSQIIEGLGFRIKGYQADFDAGNSYTGIFYDEGGRGILVPRCRQVTIDEAGQRTESAGDVTEAAYLAGLRKDDWNEVVVTAKGNMLTHSINGKVSAVLVDRETDQAEAAGLLALQLHAGPPMKVMFKDIELTVLDD